MPEQLRIYQKRPLQRKQIMAVAARSVVVNLLVLPVWTIFFSLVFILSALLLALVFAKYQAISTVAILIISLLAGASSTAFIGYCSAANGQGPSGHLRHRKLKAFTASSALSLLPVYAFCGYLVFTNILDNDSRYIAFYSFMVMLELPIYVFGQCVAILISARKLRSAAQIERSKHTS